MVVSMRFLAVLKCTLTVVNRSGGLDVYGKVPFVDAYAFKSSGAFCACLQLKRIVQLYDSVFSPFRFDRAEKMALL